MLSASNSINHLLKSGMLRSNASSLVSKALISPSSTFLPIQSERAFSATATDSHKFEFRPFQGSQIEVPEPYAVATKDELLKYFSTMFRMRRMEIAADLLYKGQFIRGFCHLYDGQEAVCVGIDAATTYNDPLITSYRAHCQQLSRGSTADEVLAELTGRHTGCTRGKGGSMHMYHPKNKFYGGNGIVGAQGPLGIGLAFAEQYNGTGGVSITMFGDGAANQGQISEAINMAKLWKLPVIFVCENNKYGMGTSTARASGSGEDFYKRGAFIPGMKIDGMDVLAVREGFKFAREYAATTGPIYVEVDTYRYHGHSMSDPGITYRSRDEISDIRGSRDPIDRVKARIIEAEFAAVADLKKIEKDIKKEIDDAVKFAKTSPVPPLREAWINVYQDEVPIRGTLVDNGFKGTQ